VHLPKVASVNGWRIQGGSLFGGGKGDCNRRLGLTEIIPSRIKFQKFAR
jgi:hypothetical protein